MKIKTWFNKQNITALAKQSGKTRVMMYKYIHGETRIPLDVASIWGVLSGLSAQDIDAPYDKKFKDKQRQVGCDNILSKYKQTNGSTR